MYPIKKLIFLSVTVCALIPLSAQSEDSTSTLGTAYSAPAPASNSAARSIFNPDMSVNFLTLGSQGHRGRSLGAPYSNGILLQEAEIQAFSDVDPYFKANALFSISPDGSEKPDQNGKYGIDPEEVYVETTAIAGLTVRAGKFKAAFGRHNSLHTHAFPFIDGPLPLRAVFGEEGLNEGGVSAAVLVPGIPWYSEVTAQILNGRNETAFRDPSLGRVAGLGRVRNLWDVTDDLTADLGLSGVTGTNSRSLTSTIWGIDLTWKWRPTQGGKYTALIWGTEYLNATLNGDPRGDTMGGISSWIQYQFAERWWAQARAEYFGLPKPVNANVIQKQSLLLGYFPSEFSGLRLQYDHLNDFSIDTDFRIALQLNISIGAHPAHSY